MNILTSFYCADIKGGSLPWIRLVINSSNRPRYQVWRRALPSPTSMEFIFLLLITKTVYVGICRSFCWEISKREFHLRLCSPRATYRRTSPSPCKDLSPRLDFSTTRLKGGTMVARVTQTIFLFLAGTLLALQLP